MTEKQQENKKILSLWLNSRGGRTIYDIEIDIIGPYIMMGNRKVRLPSYSKMRNDLKTKSFKVKRTLIQQND